MKVILRQNYETLGNIGDVVNVKNGYARNYLFPRKIAYPATKGNLLSLEEEKKQQQFREVKVQKEMETLAQELAKISVSIPMKVGEEDKLFGSVTSQMIADALKEKNFTIDKRIIEIGDQIKSLGVFDVPVKLHSKVQAKVKVWVVKE